MYCTWKLPRCLGHLVCDSAEEVKCFVISQEEYTHTTSESRGGLSISPRVLMNSSLGLGSKSKAAPHLTFSQVTQSPLSPSSPSEVLSETEPGLPDCDRPPRPQHTGTVRRGDPLAAVLELPGQTGSQVACMTFKAQLSTVSCGEALQGPLREPTATLLLIQILCSPHSQAVDSHPRVCLLLCRNHTSRWNWLLNPKVLVLPLLLVGRERRPFSRDLQSTECLEPGLLTQP